MRNLFVFLIFVIALFAVACSSDDGDTPADAGTDVVVDVGTDAPMEGPPATDEAGPEEAGPQESGPVEAGPEDATPEASADDGAAED